MISMIVAVADNDAIGKDGALPWGHIPADMQWFRAHTTGKVVVMGSTTWQGLPPQYRPLPNRTNVVLTSSGSIPGADQVYAGTPEDVIKKIESDYPDQEIVIMGGAKVYRDFAQYVKKMYLTRVRCAPEADTFLPIDQLMSFGTLKLTETTTLDGDPAIELQIWE